MNTILVTFQNESHCHICEVLHDFGIDHNILSVTCDNTPNNDTMINEMDMMLTKFSSINHTHCFTHILNLVAKSLLKQFDVKQDEKRMET